MSVFTSLLFLIYLGPLCFLGYNVAKQQQILRPIVNFENQTKIYTNGKVIEDFLEEQTFYTKFIKQK